MRESCPRQIDDEGGADLLRCSLLGQMKYGTTHDRGDLELVDWLQHACAEALDLANYLTCCIRSLATRRR